MNAKDYMKAHDKGRIKQVCDLAVTKPSYLSYCARGHGKMSIDIAIGLEAASRVLADSHSDYMTVEELLQIDERVKQSIYDFTEMLTCDETA